MPIRTDGNHHGICCYPYPTSTSWILSTSNWKALALKILPPLDCKKIQPVHPKISVLVVHWKDWCWSWNSNTLATSCEELTHWKRPQCWEGLGAGGEGDDRGWDGWMASPTRRTSVWVDSRSLWRTGRPGVLRFMGSQRVGHDWVTELNWTELILYWAFFLIGLTSQHSSGSYYLPSMIARIDFAYLRFNTTFVCRKHSEWSGKWLFAFLNIIINRNESAMLV